MNPVTSKFETLTIYKATPRFAEIVTGIEIGRILHRDSCAADPQRMPPPKIEEFYRANFQNEAVVNVQYHKANKTLWPVIDAVNRAVSGEFGVN